MFFISVDNSSFHDLCDDVGDCADECQGLGVREDGGRGAQGSGDPQISGKIYRAQTGFISWRAWSSLPGLTRRM